MIALMWHASTAIREYLRTYMPSNIVLDLIRTRRGLKFGVPVALVLVPSLLDVASLISMLIATGAPSWLHLLVLILLWDAMKFAAMGMLSVVLLARARLRETRVGSPRASTPGGARGQTADRAGTKRPDGFCWTASC